MQAAEFLERDAILKETQPAAAVFRRQAHAAVAVFLHELDEPGRNFTGAVDLLGPRAQFTLGEAAHRVAHRAQLVAQFDIQCGCFHACDSFNHVFGH